MRTRNDQDKSMDELRGSTRQYSTGDGLAFRPCSSTCHKLPPGVYNFYMTSDGPLFHRTDPNPEKLFEFPDTNIGQVVDEIERFWSLEEHFKEHRINYKRGLLLYGPPGTGKSCAIRIVSSKVINRGGIVVSNFEPSFMSCYDSFRRTEPETPLLVIIEDLDAILQCYNESSILNMLDGIFHLHKVVFLATTNHPQKLGSRIIDRPSRFDRRFEIGYPNEKSRFIYLKSIWPDVQESTIADWAARSSGLSFAHLKELFVSVHLLENKFEDALAVIKSMRDAVSSEDERNMRSGANEVPGRAVEEVMEQLASVPGGMAVKVKARD